MASSNKASGGYLHFHATPQMKSAVEELARKDGRSVSNYLRVLVEDHLMEQGYKLYEEVEVGGGAEAVSGNHRGTV